MMIISDYDSYGPLVSMITAVALIFLITMVVVSYISDTSMKECLVCHKKEQKQNMHVIGEPMPEYLCQDCFRNLLIKGASK